MLNMPALLMSAKKKEPQAFFSLCTPWLYSDGDRCGNPRHEPGHENGSGASGPCGGYFSLDLLTASGDTLATLKNKDRYEADPYEMFYGTWGEFYESPRVFNESLALTPSANRSSPIRAIKFNLHFGDFELTSVVPPDNNEEADKIGSLNMTIETSSASYRVVRDSAIYCYYTDSLGSFGRQNCLTIRDIYGYDTGFTVNLPETLSLYYKDICRINIAVTAGVVAWYRPQQEMSS